MKITKVLIKQFEQTQKSYGTEVAIHDLLWGVAASLFKNIGVKGIRTTYFKKRNTRLTKLIKTGAKK